MQDQEQSFLSLAVQMGFLGVEEARECMAVQKKMVQVGLSKTIWEVAFEKKFLTQHQISKVSSALRQSRSSAFFPGYRIVKKLGQGGMGTVYLAIQTSLERKVALKVLSPEHFKDKDYLQRIAREAKTLAKLNHPNIVSAIDFGVHNGVYYLVMEYVDGVSLDDEVKKGVVFKEKETLGIALQMASALEHAHQSNLIHRDIKPANIMIDRKGIAKLCDLGLAKEAGGDQLHATQGGGAVGTPVYMSPEQARGEKNLDIRSDIYSLGASMYTLVTGQPPYKAPGVGGIFAQILSDKVPNPRKDNPDLTPSTVRLIRKMMAKNAIDRPRDPTALTTEIKTAQRGGSFSTVSRIHLSEIRGTPYRDKQKTLLLAGLGLLCCMLLILCGVLFLGSSKEKKQVKKTVKNIIKKTVKPKQPKTPPKPPKTTEPSKQLKPVSHPPKPSVRPGPTSPRDKSLRKLLPKIFSRAYRRTGRGVTVLSYKFNDDPAFLERFWDRNKHSWRDKGNWFERGEMIRFISPFASLQVLYIGLLTPGDFYVRLAFQSGKTLGVFWRSARRMLELKQGEKTIKKAFLDRPFSAKNPLVMESFEGELRLGYSDKVQISIKVEEPLKYFILVPQMDLKISKITLAIGMDKLTIIQAVKRLKIRELLQKVRPKKLALGGKDRVLLSQKIKRNVLRLGNGANPLLAYEFSFEFSFPKGDFFSLYVPFGEKVFRWVFKRGPRTGYFPLCQLMPAQQYFSPGGKAKLTWHKVRIRAVGKYFLWGEIDGIRDFTLDYRYPVISPTEFNYKFLAFFSKGDLELRNLQIKGLGKE